MISEAARRSRRWSSRQSRRRASAASDCTCRSRVAAQASRKAETHAAAAWSMARAAYEPALAAPGSAIAAKACCTRARTPSSQTPGELTLRIVARVGRRALAQREHRRADRGDRDQRGHTRPAEQPPLVYRRVVGQGGQQAFERREAIVGLDRQTSQQSAAHPGGHAGALRRRPDLVRPVRVELLLERQLVVEREVERHAEAELVGAGVAATPQQLLRRHVGRRAA